MRVLITSGATREPIDSVRFISNISSGRTGKAIAECFLKNNIDVTFFSGIGSQRPSGLASHEFTSASSLDKKLQSELSTNHYDGIIHLAAVSDYEVENVNGASVSVLPNKLNSSDDLSISFKRTVKILPKLKIYSKNKKIKIVGFKLTNNADDDLVNKKIKKIFCGKVDFVVHNDLTLINGKEHPAVLYKENKKVKEFKTKQEIALGLLEEFKNDTNT